MKYENSETGAEKFCRKIETMRNPHIRDYGSFSEMFGMVPDYLKTQEQRDLENYAYFMNSFAFDEIKDIGSELFIDKEKPLSLILRKVGSYHDEV